MPNDLNLILETLTKIEPLFHAAYREATEAHFEDLVALDFWEIGASGKIYDRAFAINTIRNRTELPSEQMWQTSDFTVKAISNNIYILNYILKQVARTTRRTSIWKNENDKWQVIYHQGTLIT